MRGAGWTVADDPRVERETRLRDLLALFDVLHIERTHLVAHDMGVITAMQLTYDHPERVRTAVQLAVPPAFMTFSPKVLPGFRHLPALVWHRPGASLRGTFSQAYVARPMSEATVEAHLAPMRRPDIDGAVRSLLRGMVLPKAVRMARGGLPTSAAHGADPRRVRPPGPPVERTAGACLPQSGAVRRSRRVRLRRRRSAFHHRRRPSRGRRPRDRLVRTSSMT
nr:alpha/beta hydrolase [Rhodococcus sp. 14C212]